MNEGGNKECLFLAHGSVAMVGWGTWIIFALLYIFPSFQHLGQRDLIIERKNSFLDASWISYGFCLYE